MESAGKIIPPLKATAVAPSSGVPACAGVFIEGELEDAYGSLTIVPYWSGKNKASNCRRHLSCCLI